MHGAVFSLCRERGPVWSGDMKLLFGKFKFRLLIIFKAPGVVIKDQLTSDLPMSRKPERPNCFHQQMAAFKGERMSCDVTARGEKKYIYINVQVSLKQETLWSGRITLNLKGSFSPFPWWRRRRRPALRRCRRWCRFRAGMRRRGLRWGRVAWVFWSCLVAGRTEHRRRWSAHQTATNQCTAHFKEGQFFRNMPQMDF